MTQSNVFTEYEFEIRITAKRKNNGYYGDTLCSISVDESVPLPGTVINPVERELDDKVQEALRKCLVILRARGDYEQTVRLLESGDVIEQ